MFKKLLNSNSALSFLLFKLGKKDNKKGRDFIQSNSMLSYDEKTFIENIIKTILKETNGDRKSAEDYIKKYLNNTEKDYAEYMLEFYINNKYY